MPTPTNPGLLQVGESALLKSMVRGISPLTTATNRLLDTAVEIHQEPDAYEPAYMARELVQCTLPHSDPGDVPLWTRVNGNLTLVIARTTYDKKTQAPVGYPFGSIPRLLLFWMTTEAVRTGGRRLELGVTYSNFLRELGLSPNTGRGKRGDSKRVQEQTRRLFGASISFQEDVLTSQLQGERRINMPVSSKSELWWDPKSPEQLGIWGSWVELGEDFFKAITAAPVPADMRALRALKRSPLALDLYVWATHKAFTVRKKGKSQFVPWRALMKQFGSGYADPRNFQRYASLALKKIQTVYPGLKLADDYGGIRILPSSLPAIPMAAPKQLSPKTL